MSVQPYTIAMLNQREIADAIVNLTADYTEEYFFTFQKDLDKQHWAALHLGFIAGMKLNGYSETMLHDSLADVLRRIPDQS